MFLNTLLLYLYLIIFSNIIDVKCMKMLNVDFNYTYRGYFYKLIDPIITLFIFNVFPIATMSFVFIYTIINYMNIDMIYSITKLKYLIVTKQIKKIKGKINLNDE